jgi:hypothetical protein
MPISYAARKKRRQALLQQLPPVLRERLALRHVEAVVRLPLGAQDTLGMALSAGLGSIPVAIAYLQEQPDASLEEVLQACRYGLRTSAARTKLPHPASGVNIPNSPANPDPEALADLAGLLQTCFPGMPELTAQALAADELLSGVLALARAGQACFRSTAIQSELVFVTLCGWALRFIGELNRLMDSRPHYQGALVQSGLAERKGRSGVLLGLLPGEGEAGISWPWAEQPASHMADRIRLRPDQSTY